MNQSNIVWVFSLSVFQWNAFEKPSLSILLMLIRLKSVPHHDDASLLMFYSIYGLLLFFQESYSTPLKIASFQNPYPMNYMISS